MREPTEGERAELERRKAAFDAFFQESMPVLVDFAGRLKLPEAWRVLNEPDLFLPAVDAWMAGQEVAGEDRVWIITCIGYFVGYLLTQRFGGHWLVEESPGSPFFAHYVVGGFSRLPGPYRTVEPFALAADYVDKPPGRSLIAELDLVERHLRAE